MTDVKLLNESMEIIAMVNSDSFKGDYQKSTDRILLL